MFDQMRLHDVVYDGYVRLYIWIPHPEISLKAYFQLYSPITLLDIEFFHFPRV